MTRGCCGCRSLPPKERVADARERTELASTIGELQAQSERQQQEVEFYRGLAQPGQAVASAALRVQQFHISATTQAQRFLLRFSLNRVTRPGEAINGNIGVTVEGARGMQPMLLDLAALGAPSRQLGFTLRYTTTIEQAVQLPPGFKPDRVTIEVRPVHTGMTPYRQTFVWNVD